ncbi:MAG: hypothetical protein PGN30_13015, partial [Mycolicibacterium neoaurum]
MSDNTIELPPHSIETISEVDVQADGPIRVVAANGENGLETQVIDLRAEAPHAFAPRTVPVRVVTDTASFLAELTRRPLVPNHSTVWGNRHKGEVTAIYDELPANTLDDFTPPT